MSSAAPKMLDPPGTSAKSMLMLPVRIAFFGLLYSIAYPLVTTVAFFRAIYLKLKYGPPSAVMKQGTHPVAGKTGSNHAPDSHYPAHLLFSKPFDKEKLMPILIKFCAEDGIKEDQIEVEMHEETPKDFPETGSWPVDHFIPQLKDTNVFDWIEKHRTTNPGKTIRLHIWNGEEGKPTVVVYGGSGQGWDGSSNFNFVKELMSRYVGNEPNSVFQKPAISAEAAAKLDQGSFVAFLLKLPFNTAHNLFGFFWNNIRAAKWAGGNGFGFQMAAMNFTEEESKKLYAGCKTVGLKPFSAFTYAAVKGCKEVFGTQPTTVTQQASIQSRHYPAADQGGKRNFVGDWLFGPVQQVGSGDYTYEDAQKAYVELGNDLTNCGEQLRAAFWAKAYGVINSGAAGFELFPFYNDNMHVLDKCIFMNNYGVRTMDPKAGFVAWNWNAPLWFGVNTINVNGKTTTFVGSMMFGKDLVLACRDHMEGTLRGIMDKAPVETGDIPVFDGHKK